MTTHATHATIPGPDPVPILGWRGNLLRHMRSPLESLARLHRDHGPVVRFVKGGNSPLLFRPTAGGQSTLFAFGPEPNREVLTQPDVFESDFLRGPQKCEWLVHNMSSANREARAAQRRMMMPALARNHLRSYHGDIVRLVGTFLDGLEADETVDVARAFDDLAADIASRCFYGQDPDEHHLTLAGMAREVAEALFSPVSMIPLDVPGSPYRRFLRLSHEAGEAVWREIERKRQAGLDGDDVLTMMIRAHDEGEVRLSRTELIGNAFTLFLAGHDVPANALDFTCYLLAQHPDASAALLDELEAELRGDPPSFEAVWRLPVLDGVYRESLRVLCPAVLLWRRVTSPTTLGGFDVPAGTEVLLSPFITHRDGATFPQPTRFQPERWASIRPSPFEYLPFSYGARKCLGAAFAEILIKVTIAMLVQRYRLELVPGSRVALNVTFTIKPRPGLPMVVRRQDRQFHRSPAALRGPLGGLVDTSCPPT